jgi:membrane associated rhomboid family serine protease
LIRVRIGAELHELTWEEWEDRVRAGRVPPDALVSFDAVTQGAWRPAAELELYRSLQNDAAVAWQGHFFEGPPPIVTALLVGVQIRIWWFARIPEVRNELVQRFTNWTGPALENGELWRPLSMGLLHTDLFHLVLNMLWLAYAGWNLERALGRRNVVVIYAAAVLGGATLSMFGSPQTPSLGASGGVFGLVAASTVFGLVRPELLPLRGRRLFGMAMLPYLVLMFWSGLMNDDTDNWSHFGGLLVGAGLGFVLTPEPLQHVQGWNSRIRRTTLSLMAFTVFALYALGPRIQPLVTSDVARAHASGVDQVPTPESANRPLQYQVPAGWRPDADPTGRAAFASRGGPRSFGVREDDQDQLTNINDLSDAWASDVIEAWPDARLSELEPAPLAGRVGGHRRAVIDHEGTPRGIEWWGVAEGVHTLEAVWTIDLARATRLDPLRDRLLTSIQWNDPAGLASAKLDVAGSPRSVKGRLALALALAESGRTDEAMRAFDELATEAPDDPDRWLAWLEAIDLGGVAVETQETVWSRALKHAPTGAVIVHVSDALDTAERADEALGILEIAWDRRPGDRPVRRARRSRGMSVALDADGVPWATRYDPVNGLARATDALEARRSVPLDLASALVAGASWRTERQRMAEAACEAISAGDGSRAWVPLLVLRNGDLPEVDETDVAPAVIEDLNKGADWVTDTLTKCWTPHVATALLATPTPTR